MVTLKGWLKDHKTIFVSLAVVFVVLSIIIWVISGIQIISDLFRR